MCLILSTVLAQALMAKPAASRTVKRKLKRVMEISFVSLPRGSHCLGRSFRGRGRTDAHRAGRRHNGNNLTVRGRIEHRDGVPFAAFGESAADRCQMNARGLEDH